MLHLTQHILFTFKQSWKFKLDKPDFIESVVITCREVMVTYSMTKFDACGISRKELIFLYSYLTMWMQVTTADCLHSFW